GSDRTEHGGLIAAQIRSKHLDDALVVELLDAAAELFVLRGGLGADDHEVLGRERRDAGELDLLVEGERIADPQCGGVDESDDLAGKGLVGDGATAPADLRRGLRRAGY